MMDDLGDDLLAGAGFALDQERRIGRRHALDEIEHRLHRRRQRDQPGEAIALAELLAQVLVLVAERPAGERLLDAMMQLVRLLAFLEVVERAEPDRLLGRLPSGVRGEQDDLGLGGVGLDRAEHVEPVAVRHPEIGDDQIEDLIAEALHGGGDALGLEHAVAPLAEEQREGGPRRRLVVHDQKVGHPQVPSTGNSSVTRVPRPGAESTSMRPPCAATMRSAMVRPRPLPLALPE